MLATLEPTPRRPHRSLLAFERNEPGYAFHFHYHPEIELTWIAQGRGVRYVGDHAGHYRSGELVLLGPALAHTWASHPPAAASRRRSVDQQRAVIVQFPLELLPPLTLPEMTRIRHLLDSAARGLLFTGPRAERAARQMTTLTGTSGVRAVAELLTLLDDLGHASRPQVLASAAWSLDTAQPVHSRLARLLRFVHENKGGIITLDAAARAVHLTPSACSRFFHRATGRRFSDYVVEARLRDACRLLRETDQPVASVALDCGFNNLSHFNRHFRHVLKLTPSDYRTKFQPAVHSVS